MADDTVLWVTYAGDEKPEGELEEGSYLFPFGIDSSNRKETLTQIIRNFFDSCEDVPEWVTPEDIRPCFDEALEEAGLEPRLVWFLIRWDLDMG